MGSVPNLLHAIQISQFHLKAGMPWKILMVEPPARKRLNGAVVILCLFFTPFQANLEDKGLDGLLLQVVKPSVKQKKALPKIPAGLDVNSFQLRLYAKGIKQH